MNSLVFNEGVFVAKDSHSPANIRFSSMDTLMLNKCGCVWEETFPHSHCLAKALLPLWTLWVWGGVGVMAKVFATLTLMSISRCELFCMSKGYLLATKSFSTFTTRKAFLLWILWCWTSVALRPENFPFHLSEAFSPVWILWCWTSVSFTALKAFPISLPYVHLLSTCKASHSQDSVSSSCCGLSFAWWLPKLAWKFFLLLTMRGLLWLGRDSSQLYSCSNKWCLCLSSPLGSFSPGPAQLMLVQSLHWTTTASHRPTCVRFQPTASFFVFVQCKTSFRLGHISYKDEPSESMNLPWK